MLFVGRRLANRGPFVFALVIAAAVTTSCAPKFNFSPDISASALAQIGPPTQLEFVTEPAASGGSGSALSLQPVLEIADANGNTVSSAAGTITLAAYTDATCATPAPGTLSASKSTSSGVASFSGVSYSGPSGTTIYIGASSSGLTPACSTAVNITAGAPAKLAFSTEPADPSATAGVAFATQPAVTIEDAYGNVVTSATNSVQLKPYTDAACSTAGTGTFGATTNPLSASSGVSTFGGTNYTKSGTFYVGASSAGLTSACSSAINVAAGPPAKLVWVTSPLSLTVNRCDVAENIGVQDQYGNTAKVSGSAVGITLNAGGSAKYYSDSSCGTQITTSTIAVGQSNTGNIYYSDSVVESESQSGSATGLSGTSSVGISWVLNPVLTFSPTTFAAGQCVSFTVTTEDYNGVVMTDPYTDTFLLENPGTHDTIYSNNGCTTPISTYSISSGTSSVTYYYEDTRAESLSMYTQGGTHLQWNGTAGTATVTATTAIDLALTGPTFVHPNTCYGPYTVTSTDTYGNPSAITGSALAVALSSTGSTGFYSDSGCGSSESGVSIAVGSASQMFYVSDSDSSGTYMMTAAGTGFTSGTFNLSLYTGSSSPLEQVAVGGDFACALVSGGVKCWGDNPDGELGNGTTTSSLTPVSVSGLTSGVTQITASSFGFACAIKSDSTVWCWGALANEAPGGYGAASNSSVPVEVTIGGTPLTATQISAGNEMTCAVTAGGALYCWGDGDDGIDSSPPVEVLTSGVVSVVVNSEHTCVVETGGDLKCFGSDGYSDLGDSPPGASSTPVQVFGLTTGVTSAGVSDLASCAVVSGAIQCWSTVGYGQSPNSATPAAIGAPLTSGVSSVIGGGGGDDYFFALTTAGALYGWGADYCCGNNNSGIFGNNSLSTGYNYTSPHMMISSGVQSVSIADHAFSACAIVSGNLECWGDNTYGQNGTLTLNDNLVFAYPGSLE